MSSFGERVLSRVPTTSLRLASTPLGVAFLGGFQLLGRNPLRAVVWAVVLFGGHDAFAVQQTGDEPAQVGREVGSFDPESKGFFLLGSFGATAVYDDNLFATEVPLEAFFTRLTPTLAAIYETTRVELEAGYTMSAEIFEKDREEFNEALARQEAGVRFTYRPSRRTTFAVDGSYLDTLAPSEFIVNTGIDLGRRRSEGYALNVDLLTRLTSRMTFEGTYAFEKAELERLETAAALPISTRYQSHTVGGGWSYQASSRNAVAIDYALRIFTDEDIAPLFGFDGTSFSHVATIGFVHQLSGRIALSLLAGPRLTEAPIVSGAAEGAREDRERLLTPEAGVTLEYRWRASSLSLRYQKSQIATFGVSGFVNTDSISVGVVHRAGRRFQFDLSPGVFRNERGGASIIAYRARTGMVFEVARSVALRCNYSYSLQDGQFVFAPAGSAIAPADIYRNQFMISLDVGHSFRLD